MAVKAWSIRENNLDAISNVSGPMAIELIPQRGKLGTPTFLPQKVVLTLERDVECGPPMLKRDGTSVEIFDDGRWVCTYHIVHRSRHAKWQLAGRLYFQYRTSPHRVDQLGETPLFAAEMSHGDGNRHFQSKTFGVQPDYSTHFSWLSRADIVGVIALTSRRVD